MATKLRRSYSLPAGKTIHGMKDALKSYFNGIPNTDVTVVPHGPHSYEIRSKTKYKALALGADFQVTVDISQNNRTVEVHYREETNQLLATATAIVLSVWWIGLCGLYGVASRREIPIKIDEKIQAYLNS